MSYRILIEVWDRPKDCSPNDDPSDSLWFGEVWAEPQTGIAFDRACRMGQDIFNGCHVLAQQGQVHRVDVTLQRVQGHDERHWTRTRNVGGHKAEHTGFGQAWAESCDHVLDGRS